MKKEILLQPVLLLTVIVFFLISCSKDEISPGNPTNKGIVQDNETRMLNRGSVTGYIWPALYKVSITVHNKDFSSDKYYYGKDGRFRLDRIPPGLYNVTVAKLGTSSTYEISKVYVEAGRVTDVGKIIIE